jgi:hypothetical protein
MNELFEMSSIAAPGKNAAASNYYEAMDFKRCPTEKASACALQSL